jgi:hypothetical protein
MAYVTRKSIITGVIRTLNLKLYEQDEFERLFRAVSLGELSLEEAFPKLSNDAKDFIVYGTTKEEWDNAEYGLNKGEMPIIYNTPDKVK